MIELPKTPREQGYRSFIMCQPRICCPFPKGTAEAEQWIAGWDMAQNEAEDAKYELS